MAKLALTELYPKWIHPNVFVFVCPHCRTMLLLCKNIRMQIKEQQDLILRTLEMEFSDGVVPMAENAAWKWDVPKFETMSVTPSINAAPAGHWHGHIKKGIIIP